MHLWTKKFERNWIIQSTCDYDMKFNLIFRRSICGVCCMHMKWRKKNRCANINDKISHNFEPLKSIKYERNWILLNSFEALSHTSTTTTRKKRHKNLLTYYKIQNYDMLWYNAKNMFSQNNLLWCIWIYNHQILWLEVCYAGVRSFTVYFIVKSAYCFFHKSKKAEKNLCIHFEVWTNSLFSCCYGEIYAKLVSNYNLDNVLRR